MSLRLAARLVKPTARRLTRRAAALGIVLGAMAASGDAAADDTASTTVAPVDAAGMTRAMHHYFSGEKGEGVWFMTAGFSAIAAGGLLYSRRSDLARGAMYPVVAVGVLQLVVGVAVYFRTDAQVSRLDHALEVDAREYRTHELERIRRVNREFTFLKWTEIGLAAGGVGLAVVGAQTNRDTLKGIGIGLAVQSVAMLALDLLAADRAHEYTDALGNFRF